MNHVSCFIADTFIANKFTIFLKYNINSNEILWWKTFLLLRVKQATPFLPMLCTDVCLSVCLLNGNWEQKSMIKMLKCTRFCSFFFFFHESRPSPALYSYALMFIPLRMALCSYLSQNLEKWKWLYKPQWYKMEHSNLSMHVST